MAGNWSELQPELLVSIAIRMQLVEDFMGFRGVCSAWRAAATKDIFLKSWPTVPLLMLAEKKDSDDRELYSLSRGKICMRISVPEAKSKKCIESRGWLIMVGRSGEISLLHPFSRAQIQLPNLNTLPEFERYAKNCADPQIFCLERAVLSANPSDTTDFVLMVVHSTGMHLGFWRPGDKCWTRIESNDGAFSDVNYFNGKFYAIGYSGHVWVWDVSGPNITEAQSIMIIDDRTLIRCRCLYMVESSSGDDLLVVSRNGIEYIDDDDDDDDLPASHEIEYNDDDDDLAVAARYGIECNDDDDQGIEYNDGDDKGSYGVTNFRVIELDVNKCEWKEISSIGSDAIFVGHNAAFSVDATRFPDTIKPNCVYFSDDCLEAYRTSYRVTKRGGGKDMGIYHLEDGRIERFEDVESFSPISPPLWVAPSFS